MNVPNHKLIPAREPEGYKYLGVDWDCLFDDIPQGMMMEFERNSTFENSARAVLHRRQKNGGRQDYYCYAKGPKFFIARRE